eukprot:TRINITY_DN17670_c0_g1_i1.p1 TRINITY_DN17670_c0_g1~~TRINITY_DN17670_c0_g1_i1.p1  ORF type:complete len:485 (+),score=62.98 TRINITY_DN17670_c0_g1_i1:4-1458(+)
MVSKDIKVWIYFQGKSRKFAKFLNEKIAELGIISGIDEQFNQYFPEEKTIKEMVLKSINTLCNNAGIAIIIMTEEFFQDGRKNDYNPSDEFDILIPLHRLGKIKIIPIWYQIKVDDVKVPDEFRPDYEHFKGISGHVEVDEIQIHKICEDIKNKLNLKIDVVKHEFSVVVLGETGNGKSQLCNFLSGSELYPASSGANSKTEETTINVVDVIGLGRKVRLCDTPGMNDSENRDSKHIEKMVTILKQVDDVKAFILVINSEQPRFSDRMKQICKLFRDVFKADYLVNLCLVFTRWYWDKATEGRRQRSGKDQKTVRKEFNEILKTQLDIDFDINVYFLDADPSPDDEESVHKSKLEIERLFHWAVQNHPYDCGNIIAVKIRQDKLVDELDNSIVATDQETKVEDSSPYEEYINTERTKKFNNRKFRPMISVVTHYKTFVDRKTYTRTKNTKKNGEIFYSEWKLVSSNKTEVSARYTTEHEEGIKI